jgi:hypothetical protein
MKEALVVWEAGHPASAHARWITPFWQMGRRRWAHNHPSAAPPSYFFSLELWSLVLLVLGLILLQQLLNLLLWPLLLLLLLYLLFLWLWLAVAVTVVVTAVGAAETESVSAVVEAAAAFMLPLLLLEHGC